MEKKEFTKNVERINFLIKSLERMRTTLENNLSLLDVFNNQNEFISKDFIYELTTHDEESSKKIIIDFFRSEYKYDNMNNIKDKFNYLILILFTPLSRKENVKGELEHVKNYLPLEKYNIYNYLYEKKDSFIFDYKNNKVTIKPEVIKQITEDNTIYLTNEKQLKVAEIIKNIDIQINELKKYHNSYDINYELYTLYTQYSINVPKELNLMNEYRYFLSLLK